MESEHLDGESRFYRRSKLTGDTSVVEGSKPEVAVRIIYPGRYIIIGEKTNKRYEFSDYGAIVMIDEQDASSLLEKMTSPCCGGQRAKMFEKVEV